MAILPKKMGCSCSTLQTHKDVVTEIALHLPLQSLFICRAVCKLWRDVIDSPSFKKLHNNKAKEEDEETVYLQLKYDDFVGLNSRDFVGGVFVGDDVKVSMKMIDYNKKPLNLNLGFNEGFPSPRFMTTSDISKFSRPVKGLICFNLVVKRSRQPLAICNPFLGQFKILPLSPILKSESSCEVNLRHVGIGRDEEFYKVVEVVFCLKHLHSQAHLYSSRTDSWREVGRGGVLDQHQAMRIFNSITLLCNDDGHFAHWYAWSPSSGGVVLTFDMRNEVFRMARDSWGSVPEGYGYRIVAKDDGCSFIIMMVPDGHDDRMVRIFESSICEDEDGISELRWNHVVDLEQPLLLPALPLWKRDYVIVKILNVLVHWRIKLLFYDYRARRFIGCYYLPFDSDLFDYKGTFISL